MINIDKNVEKLESSYTAGRNIYEMVQPLWKIASQLLMKINIHLPNDSAISLPLKKVSLISLKHNDLPKPINNDPDPNFDFIQ